jgi:hypothetical protein
MVWEKAKYSTIVQNPSRRGCPVYQKKLMWNYSFTNGRYCICAKHSNDSVSSTKIKTTVSPVFFNFNVRIYLFKKTNHNFTYLAVILLLIIMSFVYKPQQCTQISQKNVVKSYYDA